MWNVIIDGSKMNRKKLNYKHFLHKEKDSCNDVFMSVGNNWSNVAFLSLLFLFLNGFNIFAWLIHWKCLFHFSWCGVVTAAAFINQFYNLKRINKSSRCYERQILNIADIWTQGTVCFWQVPATPHDAFLIYCTVQFKASSWKKRFYKILARLKPQEYSRIHSPEP